MSKIAFSEIAFIDCRIDDSNRLVYRVNDNVIDVISCKGHYED